MVRGTWRLQSTGSQRVRHDWSDLTRMKYYIDTLGLPTLPTRSPARVLLPQYWWGQQYETGFNSEAKFRFSLREWKYWSFPSRAHALPDRLWAELLCRIRAEGREGSSHETRPAPAGSLRQAQRLHVARHRHLESRSHTQLRCWPQPFILRILAWSARFHTSVRSIVWASETTLSTKWKKIEVRVYFTT